MLSGASSDKGGAARHLRLGGNTYTEDQALDFELGDEANQDMSVDEAKPDTMEGRRRINGVGDMQHIEPEHW